MTNEQIEIINQLTRKLDLLFTHYTELSSQNSALQQQVSKLQQALQVSQSQLTEMEQQYESLKMAKSIEGSGADAHGTKIKINRMVREIDKCIALLNR